MPRTVYENMMAIGRVQDGIHDLVTTLHNANLDGRHQDDEGFCDWCEMTTQTLHVTLLGEPE